VLQRLLVRDDELATVLKKARAVREVILLSDMIIICNIKPQVCV
jgi:hypothetical protein